MRLLAILLLLVPLCAFAKGGGKGGGHCTTGGSRSAHGASHGGGTHVKMGHHKAPPLAEDRKVVEQDCTKPVDWSAGNVKCK